MRFAVIGTSAITERFIQAGNSINDFKLIGVYSRTDSKARHIANAYNASEVFNDINSLAKSKTIDAVYIASPNSLHYEQAKLLLENEKHVLCEKPITTCERDLLQLLEASKKYGVILLEAARHIFTPGTELLRSLLPQVGVIRRASFVMNSYSSRYDRFKSGIVDNVFSVDYAGGALLDMGIYCIQLMVALFGKPNSVVSSSIFLHNGIDAQGAAIAAYQDFLVEVSYSKVSQSMTYSTIQGESGSLLFDNPSVINEISFVTRDRDVQQVKCDCVDNQLVYEIQAFIDIVKGLRDIEVYHKYSLMTQKIMEEMRLQWNK
jgi:predicted dehydrogenase